MWSSKNKHMCLNKSAPVCVSSGANFSLFSLLCVFSFCLDYWRPFPEPCSEKQHCRQTPELANMLTNTNTAFTLT